MTKAGEGYVTIEDCVVKTEAMVKSYKGRNKSLWGVLTVIMVLLSVVLVMVGLADFRGTQAIEKANAVKNGFDSHEATQEVRDENIITSLQGIDTTVKTLDAKLDDVSDQVGRLKTQIDLHE